jgi:hypothetical protein
MVVSEAIDCVHQMEGKQDLDTSAAVVDGTISRHDVIMPQQGARWKTSIGDCSGGCSTERPKPRPRWFQGAPQGELIASRFG